MPDETARVTPETNPKDTQPAPAPVALAADPRHWWHV